MTAIGHLLVVRVEHYQPAADGNEPTSYKVQNRKHKVKVQERDMN
jgi:hypothetical protein